MEDTNNAIPPSKKRAGREISKDDPESEEDDDTELQSFKRASEEVLASRRIVKVRRNKSTPVSNNPFSGICLIPSGNLKAPEATETKDIDRGEEEIKGLGEETAENTILTAEDLGSKDSYPSEVKEKMESGVEAFEDNAKGDGTHDECKNEADEIKGCDDKANEDLGKGTAESKANDDVTLEDEGKGGKVSNSNGENEDKKDESKDSVHGEAPPLSSFYQHSSTPNAFTGFSGTGFSMSTFSFSSLGKDASTFGISSGTTFGSKSDQKIGQGIASNGTSSLFNTGTSSTVAKTEGNVVTSLQEIPVETGEENEKVAFSTDAVLFEFWDGTWKERGKGELKLNVSSTGTERARLLMRARGNFRLILNSNLYPDMKLTNMDKRGITFACVNAVSEAKDGLSTFALKFKEESLVDEFRVAVMTQLPKATAVANSDATVSNEEAQ